jgi:hypothetical protein
MTGHSVLDEFGVTAHLRRARRGAGLIVFLMAMVSPPCLLAQAAKAVPSANRVHEMEGMIDALASRNKPPRVADDVLDFPADYDFKDQDRVRAAVWALSQDESNDLWERLVGHFSDKRYSVSFQSKGEDPMERCACQLTVGAICDSVAVRKLTCAYLLHLEPEKTHPFGVNSAVVWDGAGKFIPDNAHVGLHKALPFNADFGSWCRARKGKPLYELQIELCEWAIGQIERYSNVAEKPKKEFIDAVRKEIESLEKSKKPVVDRSPWASPIPSESCKFYDSRESALKDRAPGGAGASAVSGASGAPDR